MMHDNSVKNSNRTPEEQEAYAIIAKALELINHHNVTKIGIPFFSTEEDTKRINVTYARHESEVEIKGKGYQARVLGHLQLLLKNQYKHLQPIIDILPITQTENQLQRKNDIRKIKKFIKQGGVVFLKNLEDQDIPEDIKRELNNLVSSDSVKEEKMETQESSLDLIDSLFKTLHNPHALNIWPLRIDGIDMEKDFTPEKRRAFAYAVTREQKIKAIIDLIKDIEKNSKDDAVKSKITSYVNRLPIHLHEIFYPSNIDSEGHIKLTSDILNYKFTELKDRYLKLLSHYHYERKNTYSNFAFEQRKEAVRGLYGALKECRTATQLQEIIDGTKYVHQTLRGTRSTLIPLLKSMRYEMTVYLEDHQNKYKINPKYQNFIDLSKYPTQRYTSLYLVNEILGKCKTQEDKIRILMVFSKSFSHVKSNLKDAINKKLSDDKIKYFPPVESPLGKFTEKYSIDFIQYVIKHEQDTKPFFSQKDKNYFRHVEYASKIVQQLSLCKTRGDLEKIRDEAINLLITLKVHKNTHKTLLSMLEQLPKHIDQFLLEYDVPSKKEMSQVNYLYVNDILIEIKNYPNTLLGKQAKEVFAFSSRISEASKCAMIQLLNVSDDPKDRELVEDLLVKITPQYIEEVRRKDPNGYYAQVCLSYLQDKEVNDDLLMDLKQYIDPQKKPAERLDNTLMSLKKKLSRQDLFGPHKQKEIDTFLRDFITSIGNKRLEFDKNTFSQEMIDDIDIRKSGETEKIQKMIDHAIANKNLQRHPDLKKEANNAKDDNYDQLYDAISYLKPYQIQKTALEQNQKLEPKLKLTWLDLYYDRIESPYKLLLNYLYYTNYPSQSDTFSVNAIAILAILIHHIPEEIDGCKIKNRLNKLYDKAYASLSYQEKMDLIKEIAHIQSQFDQKEKMSAHLAEDFIPDLKQSARTIFLNELSSILNDENKLINAINMRASIKEKILVTNLQDLEKNVNDQIINKGDNSQYQFHIVDPGRLGTNLKKKVNLEWDQFNALTPFEKLKYDAAVFAAVTSTTDIDANQNFSPIVLSYNTKIENTTDETTIKTYLRDQKNFRDELMQSGKTIILEHFIKSHTEQVKDPIKRPS